MLKNTYTLNLNYTFDPNYKGAHYVINNKHMNAGEFIEVALKACKGYEASKDANTRFDMGSDIEETHTSVKTFGFSLCESIANTFEDTINEYFKRTASNNVSYALLINEEIVEYNMNMDEFKEMLVKFGTWCKDGKKIRVKKNPLKWLEIKATI